MNMDRIEIQRLDGVSRMDPVAADVKSRLAETRRQQSDGVDLSPEARSLAQLFEAARRMPDVREERVASLRSQIATGTFTISLEDLARRLLGNGAS
ncbi:MAG TPA: flagellar biosynthesis anti-sigma factor FlgM [Chloroflexota bacterium]